MRWALSIQPLGRLAGDKISGDEGRAQREEQVWGQEKDLLEHLFSWEFVALNPEWQNLKVWSRATSWNIPELLWDMFSDAHILPFLILVCFNNRIPSDRCHSLPVSVRADRVPYLKVSGLYPDTVHFFLTQATGCSAPCRCSGNRLNAPVVEAPWGPWMERAGHRRFDGPGVEVDASLLPIATDHVYLQGILENVALLCAQEEGEN